MDTNRAQLRALRREVIDMVMQVEDAELLGRVMELLLDAGIEPYVEIRTVEDLEARFRKAEEDYAAGRYITTEELLEEIKTW